MVLPIHIRIWLVAAGLHEAGQQSFSSRILTAKYARMFGEVTLTVQVVYSAHANASSPKHNAVIYNYLVRVGRGEYRLCHRSDRVHSSRIGAQLWPDKHSIPSDFWPLWAKITARQRDEIPSITGTAAAAALPIEAPTSHTLLGGSQLEFAAYQEGVLTHLLVGDLLRALWPIQLTASRPSIAQPNYDLALKSQGVLRHVQLRSSFEWTSDDRIGVDAAVFDRPTGCVVWTRYDRLTFRPVEFMWLGERPAEQSSLVPQGRFTPVGNIHELIHYLFGVQATGPAPRTDAERLVAYIRGLSQFRMEHATAGNYQHMGATITEAILQAGTDYRRVVRPRVDALMREHPEADTTSRFLALLLTVGSGRLLDYRGAKPGRVVTLARFLAHEGVETELQLKVWLAKAGNADWLLQLPWVGEKTVDYLQSLVGIDTSAIDRHLAEFVARVGNVANTDAARNDVIEEAARLIGVEKRVLEYSIWLYMSDLSRSTGGSR